VTTGATRELRRTFGQCPYGRGEIPRRSSSRRSRWSPWPAS